jgi:hypothetical protein
MEPAMAPASTPPAHGSSPAPVGSVRGRLLRGAAPHPWPQPWKEALLAGGLAAALVAILLVAQWRVDFNVADEGFQWYGAIETAHGGVPLRDFASYDPGRYYWSAAWARLLGDGILELRLSTAVFQLLGLWCGLLAARRAVRRPWALALVGVALALWMTPRHKLFEPSLAMAAVWIGVRLVERPTARRHFAAGALVGVATFFGKNHGVYMLAAFLALQLYLAVTRRVDRPGRRFLAWCGGLAAGLAPLAGMLLWVPGFARAYLDSCLFFLFAGRTNVQVPFPWPWRGLGLGLGAGESWVRLSLGAGFAALAAFLLAAAFLILGQRRFGLRVSPLLLSGFCVGLGYAHHAFSRADPFHLAQGIHPALLGALAIPGVLASWQAARQEDRGRSGGFPAPGRSRAALALALSIAVLTVGIALPQAPFFQRLAVALRAGHATGRGVEARQRRFVPYELVGERLWLRYREARFFERLEAVNRTIPAGERVLIAAHLPGLFPVLRRRSPVWDIYPLWPALGERDSRMLAELRRSQARWAIVADYPMPGSEELRFPNTHPQVWGYLERDFDRVEDLDLPRHILVLRRDPVPPGATTIAAHGVAAPPRHGNAGQAGASSGPG